MGGVKLKDNIDYNRRVSYYGKIGNQFNKSIISVGGFEKWYLPDWEDNETWKKQYSKLNSQDGGNLLRSQYPTPESFRDYCFTKANKDKEASECNSGSGWCMDCARDKSWN